jgi:hypothetical protein
MRFWTFVIVTAALRQLPAQADRTSVAGPDHVDITWMSITNMYYELGPLQEGARVPDPLVARPVMAC